jgi:hypothetical protein
MSVLAAMTLPALVVLLVVAGAIEAFVVRRRRKRGDTSAKQHVAAAGFDALGMALAPSTRHKKEHDEFMELKREEEGDAAPPRSRVDLDAGTARIVVPSAAPTPADRSPDGSDA